MPRQTRLSVTDAGRPRPRRPLGRIAWLWAVPAVVLLLGCQAPPPAAPPPTGVAAVHSTAPREAAAVARASDRRDLEHDERRGGHTLARHVGRSDAELAERLRRERQISAASAYRDRDTAERVVARALTQHRGRVDQWLARQGPRPNLALQYRAGAGEPIGRVLTRRGRTALASSDAVVVLRWDGGRDYYVLTSYPELSR